MAQGWGEWRWAARADLDVQAAIRAEMIHRPVNFMEGLMQPRRLHHRIMNWAQEGVAMGRLPARALPLIGAVLHRGEIPRTEVAPLLGAGERHARRLLAELSGQGIFVADHARAPLTLGFPIALADRWMPGLFPQREL